MVGVSGFTESPPRASLSEMTNEVARYVRAPDDDEVREICAAAINDGIRALNRRFWYWSLTFQDIATVADYADYALGGFFDALRHIELLDGDGNPVATLACGDPKTFGQEFSDSRSAGDPCAATVYNFHDNGQLTLDVRPTASWVAQYPTMRVRYFRRLPILVDPAGTMIFAPSEAELFVKWHGKFQAASSEAPDRMGAARAERDQTWALLIKKDSEAHFKSGD